MMTDFEFPNNSYYSAKYGKMYLADSLDVVSNIPDESVNLVMTSPPFGLVRKKEYGNVDSVDYLDKRRAERLILRYFVTSLIDPNMNKIEESKYYQSFRRCLGKK